jgi:hypothetical protein
MEGQAAPQKEIGIVPLPAVNLWIDEPAGKILKDGECRFRGWATSNHAGILDRTVFCTSAGIVRCRSVDRPDAKQAHPGLHVLGFAGTLSLVDHLTAIKDDRLRILMYSGSTVVARCEFYVAPGVVRRAIQRAIAG